jgi:endonuclease/exonuclease/phosphatase family metal-dependent hydrolase
MAGIALLAACAPPSQPVPLAPANDGPCRRTVGRDGGAPAVEVAWRQPEGRRRSLDAWCTAVGPAVVHAVPDRDFGPVPDSLPVVSWNVHVGGGDVDALLADLRAGRFTGGVPVTHFVLLVQETHREDPARVPVSYDRRAGVPARIETAPPRGPRRDVAALSRDRGLAMAYAPSMRNGPSGGAAEEDRGNAVLSTLPIAAVTAVELPLEAQRRVAVSAVLAVPGAPGGTATARVTSVHLDIATRMLPGGVESRLGTLNLVRAVGGAGRTRQGVSLLRAMAAMPEPIHLAAGDFNTVWGTREGVVARFCAAFPASRAATHGPTHRAGSHLDHVFVRSPYGSAPVLHLASYYGSDHVPQLTWIRLRPPSAGVPETRPCTLSAS